MHINGNPQIDFQLMEAVLQTPVGIEPFHEWRLPDGTQWTMFYRTCAGYLLRFPNLADFRVSRDGCIVTCFPAPTASNETCHHLYLNQALPLALSKLGKLVFHASSVEVAGGAVAFVGVSGLGKSTLAASFAVSGSRFLTDDGLVLDSDEQGYQVMPSHPSIRLWADSQLIAGGNSETAPPLHFTSKARLLAGRGLAHCDQPRRLRKAYFLGNGHAQEVVIRRLSAPAALIAWVKHSFLLDVEDRSLLSAHFDGVANLVNQMPCYSLDYPRHFEQLDGLRQAIVEHAGSSEGAPCT